MYTYIYSNPQSVSVEEWEKDFARLPQWRQEKVLSYRFLLDRVLCTRAFQLLEQGLKEHYGISHVPDFCFGKNGKPFFKDYQHIHFNMSHCKHGVMCVLADEPVGCDIEDIPEKLDIDLCNYCFNREEVGQILKAYAPTVEFTRLWTLKESVLKLTGEGINDNLPILLAPTLTKRLEISTRECPDKGYVYTCARFSC